MINYNVMSCYKYRVKLVSIEDSVRVRNVDTDINTEWRISVSNLNARFSPCRMDYNLTKHVSH